MICIIISSFAAQKHHWVLFAMDHSFEKGYQCWEFSGRVLPTCSMGHGAPRCLSIPVRKNVTCGELDCSRSFRESHSTSENRNFEKPHGSWRLDFSADLFASVWKAIFRRMKVSTLKVRCNLTLSVKPKFQNINFSWVLFTRMTQSRKKSC